MSQFYDGNAIYQFISSNKLSHFEFVVGNCWQLVYGNKDGDPMLLVFAFAYADDLDRNRINSEVTKGFERLNQLSQKTQLPLVFVGFDRNAQSIDSVYYAEDLAHIESISLKELASFFKSHGLSVKASSTSKYLNDKTSSAYHKWQRDQLGNNIVVSDIDLWIIKNDAPNVILELKRSIIPLERWQPYKDDYANFILLAKLCKIGGVKFFILYNVRQKNPVMDIIDRIKLFPLSFDGELKIGEGRIYQIEKIIK